MSVNRRCRSTIRSRARLGLLHDEFERDGILVSETGCRRPAQRFEVSATPKPLAQVVRKRPNVEPGRRPKPHSRQARFIRLQCDLRDGDAHRGQRLCLVLARFGVRLTPPDFFAENAGGVCRYVPPKSGSTCEMASAVSPAGTGGVPTSPTAFPVSTLAGTSLRIERCRRRTESDVRDVVLVGRTQQGRETRRLADHEREHPCGERIRGVPVCPMRFSRMARRTTATTS